MKYHERERAIKRAPLSLSFSFLFATASVSAAREDVLFALVDIINDIITSCE